MSRRASGKASKKKARTEGPELGAPSEADEPSAQINNPSAISLSTRTLPVTVVPALVTLCARVFVNNIRKLGRNQETWSATQQWLKILPNSILPKIFAMLRASCPTLLNSAFITAYFLRGSSITLTSSLEGVNRNTISAISNVGAALRELLLSRFDKIPDSVFASVFSKLPSIQILSLSGCSKVGSATVTAVAKSCPLITSINLNYTAAPPSSLAFQIGFELSSLAVGHTALKHGVKTDAAFAKFLNGVSAIEGFSLPSLQTLKLRQTSLSDASLNAVLPFCPNLKRLDVSFTSLHRAFPTSSEIPPLEKLCLTSARLSSSDMLSIVTLLPSLKTLSLGALGGGQGSSAAMGNSSALTMNDETLARLTEILEPNQHIESINLVGNTKLGATSKRIGALADFIQRVGRRCKNLNLAGIPLLRSLDLDGLIAIGEEEGAPLLETLILNNSAVDDDAAPYISACAALNTLEVAGTKFTSAGLFPIIDACTQLAALNLTSCRGIKVVDRRRFFEVWDESKEMP